jgi:glycosyltransferase involved in cell wall biosynthesis
VNDGSEDKTEAILTEYKNKDSRIRIFDEEHRGTGLSRNLGIKNALGEFVCFMDSDDFYPEKDVLETLYNAAITHHMLIEGGCFSFFENGNIRTNFIESECGYVFAENKIVDYSDYQFDYGYHRFIYNREFIHETGIVFPNFERFQDPPFFVRIMSAAQRFYGLAKVTYSYRIHEPVWDSAKCKGLVRGLTENLKFSAAQRYTKLHFLTFKRITEYLWRPIVMQAALKYEEFAELLYDLADSIDCELLDSSGFNSADVHIVLVLFEKIESERSQVKGSWSYRVGHFITIVPRAARRMFIKLKSPEGIRI